jgi:hypothetical protein
MVGAFLWVKAKGKNKGKDKGHPCTGTEALYRWSLLMGKS